MAVITFWNDSREQSGKTLTAVAVATKMAIERNSKILLISTGCDDSTIKECFWGNESNKNTSFFNNGRNNNIAVENGIQGLVKLSASNKLTPAIITDYTRVIFKDRLEIISGYADLDKEFTLEERTEEYMKIEECYLSLIRAANQYYDIVIVDLDKKVSKKTRSEILKLSTVNVYVLSQKMSSINKYNELRNTDNDLFGNRCIPVVGKYIANFKYNTKNIARYLNEKVEMNKIPLNLLYMEAAEEANVVDLFLKLKNVKDKTDENYIFTECILKLTEDIVKKIKDMQMRMR